MKSLIAKQTATATATYYFDLVDIGSSLVVDGVLGAAESIAISYVGVAGALTTATNSDGDAVTLSLTNAAEGIDYACWISVTKPVTANAVGVNIHGIKR
jgi:hypothetical protein